MKQKQPQLFAPFCSPVSTKQVSDATNKRGHVRGLGFYLGVGFVSLAVLAIAAYIVVDKFANRAESVATASQKIEPATQTPPAITTASTNESPEARQGLPEPTTQQSESPATAPSEGSETYYGHGSYESCMSAGTWMEMAMCSSDEFQREDVRLNREYKRVIATYKTLQREDGIAELRTEEVRWLKTMT